MQIMRPEMYGEDQVMANQDTLTSIGGMSPVRPANPDDPTPTQVNRGQKVLGQPFGNYPGQETGMRGPERVAIAYIQTAMEMLGMAAQEVPELAPVIQQIQQFVGQTLSGMGEEQQGMPEPGMYESPDPMQAPMGMEGDMGMMPPPGMEDDIPFGM